MSRVSGVARRSAVSASPRAAAVIIVRVVLERPPAATRKQEDGAGEYALSYVPAIHATS
jgi:hypothetical protein